MDTIVETLKKIIEEETEKKIARYIEYISVTYDISHKLLLRDLHKDLPPVETHCKGIKKNGKRCAHVGKFGGFCKWHQDQQKPLKPVVKPKFDANALCAQFESKLLIEF